MGIISYRCYEDGDEDKIVELLNEAFERSDSLRTWRTKFKASPGFDSKLIRLAEHKGQLVGCMHALRRDIKIGHSTVKAFLGADAATRSEYRGIGICCQLFVSQYSEVRKVNGIVHYGFVYPMLYYAIYGRKLGNIAMYRPQVFLKVLNSKKVVKCLIKASNRRLKKKLRAALRNGEIIKLKMELSEDGLVNIVIARDGLKVQEKSANPDVIVKTDSYTFLKSVLCPTNLIKALILRKVRIKTSLTNLIRLIALAILLRPWR